ncbi:MAG: TonB-dependent receptor [Prevotellaceae bacterium]|nr:TonB-dependent receptor [Prevotellaceae bacterium]
MDEKLKKYSFGALNFPRQWGYLFAASLLITAPTIAFANEGQLNESKVAAMQQAKKSITGTVVDAKGDPIIGASVIEKGAKNNGTITDINGGFKLTVNAGAQLVVSYIGYQTQTVNVTGSSVQVTLKEDAESLEEVVVVGYGTAKRKDVSGAITSVKFDDGKITNLPNPNALAALSSQVAGLHYAPTSSASGDNSGTMTLRGKNVIPASPSASNQGNNAPLLIVDGVISYGGINEINTNDIATIDVLKDASAAAIYGSRAANGVIIITTKKGQTAKPTVRFNTSLSFSDWSRKPKMVDNKERFLMNRFYAKKAAGDNRIPDDQEWSMDFFNANKEVFFVTTQEMQAYEAGQWVDWIDEVTRTGVGQQYDVSVAGGNKGVKYYLSGDYSRREGVQIGDDYEKYNILSKIDIDVTDWLKVGLKANYLGWRQWGVTATLGNAEWYSPFSWKTVQSDDPKYASWPNSHPDGNTLSPLWGSGVSGGVADSNLYGVNDKNGNNINGVLTAQVDFPFLQGLSYRFTLNAQRNSSYQDTFNRPEMWVDTRSTNQMDDPTQFNNKVEGISTASVSSYWNADNILTYGTDIAKHHVDGMLGYTRESYDNNYRYMSFKDFTGSTSLGYYGAASANTKDLRRQRTRTQSAAYLARLNYNFDSKYYFTFNYRRDGFSAFAEGNKWGNFYGVSGAWVFSKEKFIEDLLPWLDYGKLRLSWGQNGSRSVNAYATNSNVSTLYTWLNNQSTLGYYASSLGNKNLTWATITKYNLGLDFSVLNNRLDGTIDIYSGRTTDMLMERSVPYPSGFNTASANIGKVSNKGIEVTLHSVNINGDGKNSVRWESNVTFDLNRNKIMSLYGKNWKGEEADDVANFHTYGPQSYYALMVGRSITAAYDLKKLGIFQSQTEIDNYTWTNPETGAVQKIQPDAKPGDVKFQDWNNDGKISAEDRHCVGDQDPLFTMNFGNTISYKNFSLYFSFRWMPGSDTHFLGYDPMAWGPTGGSGNQLDRVSPWREDNKNNDYPRYGWSNTYDYLWWNSRGFLKLKDLVFSYNFDRDLIAPLGLTSLRAYVSGTDLFTITNWSGLDPETGGTIAAGAASTKYASNGSYRTITFGLNVTF